MARIFLSHSSANNAEAIALRDWLVAEGWDDLFLDLDPQRGIVAGERWERALSEAANHCEAVLFLVSRAWLGSAWCLREFHLASKLNKRMFGVLIEDVSIGDLPSEVTATWQLVDLASGSDHRMFQAMLPDGGEAHVTYSKGGLARLKAGLTRAGLDARFFAWPPESDPDRPPYRGLRPLEAEDAGIFFGREAPTIEALDRLRGLSDGAPPRFLVILGASGAGKSSFLRAGLLPRLQRDDRNFLPLPIVRPERAAIDGETGLIRGLEAGFRAHGLKYTRAEVKAAVEAGAPAVAALLTELAEIARPPALGSETPVRPPRVVLAVDQGEELFLGEGTDEASAFLNLLQALVTDPASNLIVLVTVRSDSYEQLQSAPLLEGIQQHALSLPPLPRGAYQTVIEGPAARLQDTARSLTIEPALTATLLAEIEEGGAKDALPLLAFTLERLYLEHGGDGDLRLSEYRQIGGIRGSIEAAVEGALKAADADPAVPRERAARLALLRRALIPWLAGIDPETGAPRRRVARLSEIPEEARPLVGHLIAARLLATDVSPETGERTIEPAHEALLRQWGLLEGWLEEDFAALSTLEGVKQAARDWAANNKDDAWLTHTGGRLDDAEALLKRDDFARFLEATDRGYLEAARTADTARRNHELEEARKLAAAQKEAADRQRQVARRTRVGLIAASALAVAAIGAAVFGFEQAREAERQAMAAETQRQVAETQRRVAENQKQRAERSLAAATQAVDALLYDVVGGLSNVAGVKIETIRGFLGTIQRTVNQLTEAAPDDPVLQRIRGMMWMSFANTYLSTSATTDAVAAAQRGITILRNRVTNDPGNADAERDLVWGLNILADVEIRAGNREAALKASEDGVAICRNLAAASPNDKEAQRGVATALDQLADVVKRTGSWAGEVSTLEKGLAIRRKLAADYPDDAVVQRDLLVNLYGLSAAKLRAGDSKGALADSQEIQSLAHRLAENDPGNAAAQRDLSESLLALGSAELDTGDRQAALHDLDDSLDIARELAADDPGNIRVQWDVVVRLDKSGDAKDQAGDQNGALQAFEEAYTIAKGLTTKDPDNVAGLRDFTVILYKVANLRLKAGDGDAARAAFEESVTVARKLVALDPGSVLAKRDLARSLSALGEGKRALGDPDGALAAHQEALAIRRKLVRDQPVAADRRDLAWSLDQIAQIQLDRGDRSKALAAFEEGLAVRRKQSEENPDDAAALHDLAWTLERVGDVQRDGGDRKAALAAYEERSSILRKLAEGAPDDAGASSALAISLSAAASVSDEPAPLYREALALLEGLEATNRLPEGQQSWIPWIKGHLDALAGDGEPTAATEGSSAP